MGIALAFAYAAILFLILLACVIGSYPGMTVGLLGLLLLYGVDRTSGGPLD